MEHQNILEEFEGALKKIKKKQEHYTLLITRIDSEIEKLIFLIEHDNFNSATAYNYCKTLKELLIKKNSYVDMSKKYKGVLNVVNTDYMKNELNHKYKLLITRKYTAKVFNRPEKITEYLNVEE
jgi:hypothetical protein